MGKHYVDNKELYKVLLEYKFARLEAEKKNMKIIFQRYENIMLVNAYYR